MPGLLKPDHIVVPDLAVACPFRLQVNRFRKQASAKSRTWFFRSDPDLNEVKHDGYDRLNPGLLAAMVYPHAGCPQLRVCIDFLAYIFYLDNLTDDMDNRDSYAVGDIILNSFYHPCSFKSSAKLGVMAAE